MVRAGRSVRGKVPTVIPSLLCAIVVFAGAPGFPAELVEFTPYEGNPVFEGAGPGHWDEHIRERGWILLEDGLYHLWYTGYAGSDDNPKYLGYATSPDGITWTRHPDNPVHDAHWVEDMTVVKRDGVYYMFAEGRDDQPHLLTSTDRVHWTRQGQLAIRKTTGELIAPGPYGTPAVFVEDGVWHLLYERDDEAVWLATSSDGLTWTHVQDAPILLPGPDDYDFRMIAINQAVKRDGRYYAYYHGLVRDAKPEDWTTCVAVSSDLIHWEKYPGNPILRDNKSSAVLVDTPDGFQLYTMHPAVCLHTNPEPP
ncbi:MAG: glycosylase [Candidatus Hydrogenedentes bacterium]|nr:glycosylase [Candidatus Hydrogenedentota bacterium]